MNDQFLEMLRCPIDGSTLAIAADDLVEKLNQAIAIGELRDQVDQKITQPIDGALITADQKRAYLIRKGIPSMIGDESVDVPQS